MTNKKTEKMCKELDEEGYYRWIKERDNKRFSWLNIFKKGKVKRMLFRILHMSGVHVFPHDSKHVVIGDVNEETWTCKTCGYECTMKGVLWEVIKYCLTWIAMLAFVFSPVWDFMPPLLAINIKLLLAFFSIIHGGAGLRSFLQIFFDKC